MCTDTQSASRARNEIGGLVGYNGDTGTITNSYSSGTVAGSVGEQEKIGGLVANNMGGITDSYSASAVFGSGGVNDMIGGLVGINSGAISNSYANGNIKGGAGGQNTVGGLVGTNSGNISKSYANGNVKGGQGAQNTIGGLVGANSGEISSAYAGGTVTNIGNGNDTAGGLVGKNTRIGTDIGTIIASSALGYVEDVGGGTDDVGGLVGHNSGKIIASYALNDVTGGAGSRDAVGGLAGKNSGTITASYASGVADGGNGNEDAVGGLVGSNSGTIEISYANGAAQGGGGNSDSVGGLVDQNETSGAIRFTYTTATPVGEAGKNDYVGGLVGNIGTRGTVTSSYAFRAPIHNERGAAIPYNGTPLHTLTGVEEAVDLNSGNSNWPSVVAGAWNFYDTETPPQPPELLYADYDGGSSNHACDQFPDKVPFADTTLVCGSTPVPEQQFTSVADVDTDNDLLIDITNLNRLNNIRHNLSGASYKESPTSRGARCGASTRQTCKGYELMHDLDFTNPNHYEGNSIIRVWLPNNPNPERATNSGWAPLGYWGIPFTTVFEGNGHTISNLYLRDSANSGMPLGLFGVVGRPFTVRGGTTIAGTPGTIRNLTVENGHVYGGTQGNIASMIAGVLFESRSTSSESMIINSAAIGGIVDGGADTSRGYTGDTVGGLVGHSSGIIIASYATVTARGNTGDTNADLAGGLVGELGHSGRVIASYATGAVTSAGGRTESIGGLVGVLQGNIFASYATGDAHGGGGSGDAVGAILGSPIGWYIIEHVYGFGNVVGNTQERPEVRNGTTPKPVSNASQLNASNVGATWNSATHHTSGAWVFNSRYDAPVLKYADYDGSAGIDICALIVPANACATNLLLPNQPAVR